MAQKPKEAVTRLREAIEDGERGGDEADREALIAFSNRLTLLGSEYSDHRHEKLLRHCTLLSERVGGLADALHDRDAAEALVRHINERFDNEETNQDYRTAVRVFGRRVAEGDDSIETDRDGYPESIGWIPSGTSKTYDPAPDPGKMLTWDADVDPMIEAARNERDAAAIALQMDAGLRGGEFESLTVGSINDHRHGLQVTVQGKQGQRSPTLVPSVPHVERWLSAHPAGDDPDAPLWTRLNSPVELSRTAKYKMFNAAAARVAVSKPVTPTNFRKSSASWCANKGMNQAHLEQRYGWVRGSKTASRYVSIFGDMSADEYARLHGVEIAEDGDETKDRSPLACYKCDQPNPRDRDLCMWCGQALKPGAAMVADEMEGLLVGAIADADDPTEREAFRKMWEQARDDPERRAEMVTKLAKEMAD